MEYKLSELADTANAEIKGDPDIIIHSIQDIEHAQAGSITFISSKQYAHYLDTTQASVVILESELLNKCKTAALVTKDPRLAYAKIARLFLDTYNEKPGISANAMVSPTANISKSAIIADGVIIEADVTVAENVRIGAGSVLENGTTIGKNTRLGSNVSIGYKTTIGDSCILHGGVVIGADGFGFVKDGDTYLKIPQLGNVQIKNNVEIGANTTIDRGAINDTVIDDGVKLDNQIQIAHNVYIGKNTVISAGTCIAGTTSIGANCLIGGVVAIKEHIQITDNVIITGRTLVSKSITRSGSYSSSTPMDETAKWRKNSVRFRQLDDLARKLNEMHSKKKNEE